MVKNDYEHWSKDDLVKEIDRLRKRKKYGLVWEDKPEDVVEQCKTDLPVLDEVEDKEIKSDPDKPVNLLIEGDNYHVLSVLNYTHKGKVDVIYIDPPYNTGAKDWKYNNHYVDENDQWRHSKWIAMMESRLKLAKKLISQSGFIVCAIDHNELFSLGLLMDEIFGEKCRIGVVSVVHKPEGRNQEKFFGTSNEFMLVYCKNWEIASFRRVTLTKEQKSLFDSEDRKGRYKLKNFTRLTDGKYALRENKPGHFYPIYVSPDLTEFRLTENKNYTKVMPITEKGVERTWKTKGDTFIKRAEDGDIEARRENGKIVIYEKLREDEVFKTHWIRKEYHGYHFGTKLLQQILGKKIFDFPKSLHLVEDILKLTARKNATILDFFAGSGTTGHAVLELNKRDNGSRKFILCTNNENGIATDVCYPRIKKVIEGYKNGKEKVEASNNNLKYFRTSFVPAETTDKNKTELTKKATEMLCVREDTFEIVKDEEKFRIFKGKDHHTGIIFDQLAIDDFKKSIAKIDSPFSVYVFRLVTTHLMTSFRM